METLKERLRVSMSDNFNHMGIGGVPEGAPPGTPGERSLSAGPEHTGSLPPPAPPNPLEVSLFRMP